MAAWIHSSVSSFLSSTVRLKLSPVVPFTDDKEMLAESTLALSMHRSHTSFFIHSFLGFHSHAFAASVLCPDNFEHEKKESGSETMMPLESCPDYFTGRPGNEATQKKYALRSCYS